MSREYREYRSYWDTDVASVPAKTGAGDVMDLADIREVLEALELDLIGQKVLDVGCGTGRLAQACDDYTGFDIAPGMVAYARAQGLKVYVIPGPDELLTHNGDIVCCLSVFTHISREARRHYLSVFRQIADVVLVDILPTEEADDHGSIGAWHTPAHLFEEDIDRFGFEILGTFERTSSDGPVHRYYLLGTVS